MPVYAFKVVLLAAIMCTVPVLARAAALIDAVRTGDTTAVEQALGATDDLEARDEAGLTPLVTAALNGHTDIVALLIARGADPRGRDGKGFTALHAAAHAGHADIVKLLIDTGVDIDDQRNSEKLSPLHAASERGHRRIAELLLASGAKLEVRSGDGKTPLVMATLKAHTQLIKLLRDHGADCSKIRLQSFRETCLAAAN